MSHSIKTTIWNIGAIRSKYLKVNKDLSVLNQFTKESSNPLMIRQYKPYDERLIGVLIGGLLGDLFARKGTSKVDINAKGTSFTYAQSIEKIEYINNIRSFLLEYNLCSDRIPQIERTNYNLSNPDKQTYKYVIYTTKDVYFDTLFDAFYQYNPDTNRYVKGMRNKEFIYHNFTALSLAIWIMDDGTNQNGHVKLCTDSFTLEDCKWLQSLLYNKFGIITKLHLARENVNPGIKSDQHRLYVVAKSMPTLLKLVDTYIIPSMRYKLGDKFDLKGSTSNNPNISIEITDLKTNITKSYPSTTIGAKDMGLYQSSVSKYIKNKISHPFKGRYVIKVIKKNENKNKAT